MKNVILHARFGALCFAIYKEKKKLPEEEKRKRSLWDFRVFAAEFVERLLFMNRSLMENREIENIELRGNSKIEFLQMGRGY